MTCGGTEAFTSAIIFVKCGGATNSGGRGGTLHPEDLLQVTISKASIAYLQKANGAHAALQSIAQLGQSNEYENMYIDDIWETHSLFNH